MSVRLFLCLLCALALLPAPMVHAESSGDAARQRVVDYAQSIHDYTWELPEEDGVILLYNRNYYPSTSGFRIVFGAWQPFVAYGTVRGVPYSLSAYGNGRETTFADYQKLSIDQRTEIANIYNYTGYGDRVSMRYGMSCTTFITECLKQGFPDEDLPVIHGVKIFLSENVWKRHFTFGKHGKNDFDELKPADILRNETHVMLVMENDPAGERLRVMEQTPPDQAVAECENLTDVTVTLIYKDEPTTVQAKRLCMECPACLQSTTGTQERWISYEDLRLGGFMAVFIDY